MANICLNCGAKVHESSKCCESCNHTIMQQQPPIAAKKKSKTLLIITILGILVIVLVVVGILTKGFGLIGNKELVSGGELNVLNTGDTVQITIAENVTIQYNSWFLAFYDDDILELVSDKYVHDANSLGADGAGRRHVITFLAIATGETMVELALKDYEDGDAIDSLTYLVTVK